MEVPVRLRRPIWPVFILIDVASEVKISVGDLEDETVEYLAQDFIDHCREMREKRRKEK